MGAPEINGLLEELALRSHSPSLGVALLALTRFVEHPEKGSPEAIACQLDCVADDESCDAATRAIAALLTRCWLYGEPARRALY